jgi:hypothetical protein
MKTIFLSIFDGDTERVILRTDVFTVLKDSGHKIVLLIRGKDRIDHYKSEFASEQVAVELLPGAGSRWETLWYYMGWNSIPTRAVSVRRYREFVASGNWGARVFGFLAWSLGHLRLWREFLRWIYYAFGPSYAGDIFEKYKPDLLFAANMFSPEDTRLLREAKKRGVRTVTIAKSWDVLTTKAFTRVKADRMVVYNDFNKKEAIAIGDYHPEQITVTGFPQFDIYTHQEIFKSREEFCASMKLDPARRIALYGLPGDWKSPDTRPILAELERRIEANAFVKPLQILARFHPKYTDSSEGLVGAHIVFDKPGMQFGKGSEFGIDASTTANKWSFRDADIMHLANSIYHSDVVISVDSTLTLDAAALDKPSVLIAYDGERKLPYKKSIAFIYERNHFRNVVDTGAAPLVKSHHDLVRELNAFLSDPSYRAHSREELKRRLLYKTDGQSGKRMGEAVLAALPNGN